MQAFVEVVGVKTDCLTNGQLRWMSQEEAKDQHERETK